MTTANQWRIKKAGGTRTRLPTASKTRHTQHTCAVVPDTRTLGKRRKQERLEFSQFLDSRSFLTSSYKNIAIFSSFTQLHGKPTLSAHSRLREGRTTTFSSCTFGGKTCFFNHYLKRTNIRGSLELHVHVDNHRVGYFTPHAILQTFQRLIKKRKTERELKRTKIWTMYTNGLAYHHSFKHLSTTEGVRHL